MKKYRKIIDGKEVILARNRIVVIKGDRQYINPTEAMALADGWEEYAPMVYSPTEEDIARQEAMDAAEVARGFLTDTDYKVIKCMEAFLCGESLPYDINQLHAERDEKRRLINENEQKYEQSDF